MDYEKMIGQFCRVSKLESDLEKYSVDASIFRVKPKLVAFPKNLNELKKLVSFAGANSIHLSPRAGGTCMSGGSLTEGVIVDMTSFNKIHPVDLHRNEVWVESGVFYRDLEKNLEKHNLLFPPYTSSKDMCAIGGMVGNNASGEKSLRYGATIDNVIALKMVCSDGKEYLFQEINESEFVEKTKKQDFEGELYARLKELLDDNHMLIQDAKPKVRKNSAGYGLWNIYNKENKTHNLAKLIVGSQGTLGFVTEVLLRVVTIPKNDALLTVFIDNLATLGSTVKEILAHNPEGLETFDSNTFELAKIFMKDFADKVNWERDANLILFTQFSEETPEQTLASAKKLCEHLSKAGLKPRIVVDFEEKKAIWQIRRAGFWLLKNHAKVGSLAVPCIEDTIVPIERYGDFLEKLGDILHKYDLEYAFHGHIGEGSIRLIPILEKQGKEGVEKVFALSEEVYRLAVAFGGSISVDHNDGIVRTPFLKLMFKDEVLDLFMKTKNIFDPNKIFNPGKKVLGNIDFAKKHTLLLD